MFFSLNELFTWGLDFIELVFMNILQGISLFHNSVITEAFVIIPLDLHAMYVKMIQNVHNFNWWIIIQDPKLYIVEFGMLVYFGCQFLGELLLT